LDGALSNLTWLRISLLIAEGLDQMTFEGLFQPKAFYDPMISSYDWLVSSSHMILLSNYYGVQRTDSSEKVKMFTPGIHAGCDITAAANVSSSGGLN